ncbi:WecB/TagA/CpsF family glycosyltransferase [Xylanimonas sp. McL0601]|uniref:WecB/TagA/CpsF family glycosyltransferase n=1 Tax=Xylanimonas sp. McL0601 TaxID=3414739 RepID=UPI003CE730F6
MQVKGFDLSVTPLTSEEVVDHIVDATSQKRGLTISNVNLHGLYMFETDPQFANFTKSADLCLVDGWPVLKLVEGRPLPSRYRVGSTDWLEVLLGQGGFTIAAIGGTPESSARTAEVFNREFDVTWLPQHGYDLEKRSSEVDAAIREADIVLVGLGMPRQERWILKNSDKLSGKVVANVGGCFDYYSGAQRLAPRWMGAMGLEWLYRLSCDPRRLARRYLVEPFRLARLVRRRNASRRRHA